MTDALTAALDNYERLQDKNELEIINERLDNFGHILYVTAFNADGSVKFDQYCLDADEFHQCMHEAIRDGLRYEIERHARN